MTKKRKKNRQKQPESLSRQRVSSVDICSTLSPEMDPGIPVDLSGIQTPVKAVEGDQAHAQTVHLRESVAWPVIDEAILRCVTTVATNAWRAMTKMVDPATGEAKEEMKRVYRHLEVISDALEEIGVEIIDSTGRPYDTGMALKVITFEETHGLGEEEIIETIRPSVIWQGRLIQMGEVIVGKPPTA